MGGNAPSLNLQLSVQIASVLPANYQFASESWTALRRYDFVPIDILALMEVKAFVLGREAEMKSVKWYYLSGGFVCGPVTSQQLIKLANTNQIAASTPTCRVANHQRGPWKRAGEIEALFETDSTLELSDPICRDCGHCLKDGLCLQCSQNRSSEPNGYRATIPIRKSKASSKPKPALENKPKYRNLREYILFVQIIAWTALVLGTAFLGQGIVQLVTGPGIDLLNYDSVIELFQTILPGFVCSGCFILLMAGADTHLN